MTSRWPSLGRLPTRVVLLGTLLLYGLPALFMVATSLRTNAAVYAQAFSFHFTPTIAAYRSIGAYDVKAALWSSVRITFATTAIILFFGVPAAYALARAVGKARSVGLGSLIILQLLPASTLVIPLYKVLQAWGMLGSLQGVILADTAYYLPFAIILLRPFFLGVPMALEQAAAIDGASRRRIFLEIVIPLARNGVLTVGVLVGMIVWGDFLFALTILVNPTDYPLSTLLAQQVSNYGINWPQLMALAVIAAAPIVVAFLAIERRLAAGLSLGGVK
jgi:multiple sugar transport system permease protein